MTAVDVSGLDKQNGVTLGRILGRGNGQQRSAQQLVVVAFSLPRCEPKRTCARCELTPHERRKPRALVVRDELVADERRERNRGDDHVPVS